MVVVAAFACFSLSCAPQQSTAKSEKQERANSSMESSKPQPKDAEVNSVETQVHTQVGDMAEKRRTQILKDAAKALEETRNAVAALDRGDKKAALSALEQATGKLDLVVSRDPHLALAPVGVETIIHDLYATAPAVKAAVSKSKDLLSSNEIQPARWLLQDLASEADINVSEIPLATYPAAIRQAAPLIDAGKVAEAKAALDLALNTIVVNTFVLPLPPIRAEALLAEADRLAAKRNRNEDENNRLRSLIVEVRNQLQLAEALGYGRSGDYKPLYSQIDDVEKKTEGGKSGRGLFDRLKSSLEKFKLSTKSEEHHSVS
jgi:hypothetical protein